MQCNFEKLNLFLDNRLADGQKQEIEDHIKTCKKCSDDLVFLQKYKKYAGEISGDTIPKHIHDNVVRNIGKKTISFGRIATIAAVLIFLTTGIIFLNRINSPNRMLDTAKADLNAAPVATEAPIIGPSEALGQDDTNSSGSTDQKYQEEEIMPAPEPTGTPEPEPESTPKLSPKPSESVQPEEGIHDEAYIEEHPICCR